jgi:hypothetical protein
MKKPANLSGFGGIHGVLVCCPRGFCPEIPRPGNRMAAREQDITGGAGSGCGAGKSTLTWRETSEVVFLTPGATGDRG